MDEWSKGKKKKRDLQFDNMFIVHQIHKGEGLVLFWKNSIKLSIETSSKNHIDCIIGIDSENAWQFTCFYGEPNTHKRYESWDLLKQLNNQLCLPWLCSSDFNEILRSSEKEVGSNQSHAQMQLFREAINECDFLDLGFKGLAFTWKKFFSDGQ